MFECTTCKLAFDEKKKNFDIEYLLNIRSWKVLS